jgi:hypothetical protein
MSKKTIIIAFTFKLFILAFFILVKWVSSYASIATSFLDRIEKSTFHHVMTFSSTSGCSVIHSMMSEQMFFRLFCSWVRFFGTIFAQTLLMFNWSCKICLTISLSILTISAIIQMLKRLSFRTISLIFSTFPSVFDGEGCPGRSSSSTSSQPSMNHSCHSKTHVHDITLSPYTSFSSWKHSVGVFSISQEISDWCAARFSS